MKKKGKKVSLTPVGNVHGGAYTKANDGRPLAEYNCGGDTNPGKVTGSHRRTLSVGKVKGAGTHH